MKDRYEERIQEVEGEKNSVDKKREELVERVGQLQIAVQKAELQARTAAAAGGGEGSPAANPPSVSAEVSPRCQTTRSGVGEDWASLLNLKSERAHRMTSLFC